MVHILVHLSNQGWFIFWFTNLTRDSLSLVHWSSHRWFVYWFTGLAWWFVYLVTFLARDWFVYCLARHGLSTSSLVSPMTGWLLSCLGWFVY